MNSVDGYDDLSNVLDHLHSAAENAIILDINMLFSDLRGQEKSALSLILVSLRTTWIYGTKPDLMMLLTIACKYQ